MRKIKMLVIMILLLCVLSSCGQIPVNENTQPETTMATKPSAAGKDEVTTEVESHSRAENEVEDISDVVTGLLTHYICGGDKSTKENTPQLICSAEEFKTYCEQEEAFVSEAGFQEICDRFEKEFWENYDLLMVKWVAKNSGMRHDVMSIMKNEDASESDWVITLRDVSLGAGNTVLTPWQFIIEVPKDLLKEDEAFQINYVGDSRHLLFDVKSLRTDEWKTVEGDELWDMSETPLQLMDTREQLNAYCRAHPELQGEFLEICAGFDDRFWEKRDLLLIVWKEDDSVIPKVKDVFKNKYWESDTWFVDLERETTQTSLSGSAIWHFFIEVESGKLKAEDDVEIHERKVLGEN